jgi:ribosomal protein L32
MSGNKISKTEVVLEHIGTIFDKFPAFGINQLSDAASLFKTIRKNGLSIDEFLNEIDFEVEALKQRMIRDAHQTYARDIDLSKKLKKTKVMKKSHSRPPMDKKYSETMKCPACSEVSYIQHVCPKCAKGRAGIKKQYICGECDFVFYLD